MGKGVVALLALAVFINYVDRGNLATAAPLIKDQLRLSNVQIGLLISAFFWVYTPSQFIAGWLNERLGPYRTLAASLTLWALATAAMGLAGGFAALFALRMLLGLGESAAFPCSSALLARHLPRHRLGAANGLIIVGMALGPAFGTLAGGMMMAKVGWRPVFLVFGAVSLLWLIPWLAATRKASAPHDDMAPSPPSPSYLSLLRRRDLWGASLGSFAEAWGLYFLISWVPLYLVKARGFSVSQMAEIGAAVYLTQAISAQAAGWLCDRWIAAGASDTRARKAFLVGGHLGMAGALAACAVTGPAASIACLFAAAGCLGFIVPNLFAASQTLAGPAAAGKWVSVQNAIGNLSGIIGPIVTGFIVDRTGSFAWAFVLGGVVVAAGAVFWGLVIRRVEPVSWQGRAAPALAPAVG
jgi:MFS family permease